MNEKTATVMTSGEYFRGKRMEKGLSVADAARRANLAESTIRRIEQNGVTRSFVASTILPLLSAYDIEGTDELFACSDIVRMEAEADEKMRARLARNAKSPDEQQAATNGRTGN